MKKALKKKANNKKTRQESSIWKNLLQFFLFIPVVLCFVLAGSVLTSQAHAATGLNRVINFQGRIVNKTDGTNITDGTYSFTFKLYDSASGGNLLWQETQSSVSLTNGIFQVALGSSTAFNAGGFNVDFKQNNLYLDITFNSETFGSRIQLASVPQAINSEQLDGVIATQSATGFNFQGGLSTSSVVSFSTSGTTLTIQPGNTGALTLQSNGASAITLDTGSGAAINIGNNNATAVQFGGSQNPTFTFSGTGSFTTSSGLNTLGGNVQVNGSTISLANGSSSTIQTTGANTGLTLLSNGSGNITLGQNLGNGNVVVKPNAGGQAALIVADQGLGDVFTASVGASTKFVIDKSGNVGIGTGIPGYKLEVDAGSYNTSLGIVSSDSIGPGLTLNNTGTNGHKYDLVSTGTGSQLGAGYFGIFDETNNVYKFVIDFGGNVGINTTVPSAIFDVRGIGQTTLSGTIPVASISGQTSFAGLVVDNSGKGDLLTASSSGLSRFTITQAGNVGIGTVVPFAQLQISGNGGQDSLVFDQYGTGTAPDFIGRAARGTSTSPAVVQSGDRLLTIGARGYTPSGFAGLSNAAIQIYAAQTFTNSNQGSYIDFETTPLNSTSRVERIRIDPSGNLGINATSPLSVLDVRGNAVGTNAMNGTLSVASISGQTSFAGLVIDNSGKGDLFTASSSGLPRFVVTQNGALGIGTTTPHTGMEISTNGTIGTYDYEMLMNPPSGKGARFAFMSNSALSNGKAVLMGETTAANGDFSIKTANDTNLSAGTATWLERFTVSNGGVVDIPNLSTNGVVFTSGGNGTLNSAATLATSMGGLGANVTAAGAGELLYSTGTTTYGHLPAALSSNQCLLSNGAAAPSWGSCGSGTNYWQRVVDTTSGYTVVSPATITDTFSLGVTGTGANVVPFSSFYMEPPADTKGNAMMALNQTSLGDIFTASASGATKLEIDRNGSLFIGGAPIVSNFQGILLGNTGSSASPYVMSFNQYSSGSNGSALLSGDWGGSNGWGLGTVDTSTQTLRLGVTTSQVGAWAAAANQTLTLLIDGTPGTPALPATGLDVERNSLGNAATVINNVGGLGDIFTASSAGTPKFVISGSGNVGIDTATPNAPLQVSANGKAFFLGDGSNTSAYFDVNSERSMFGYDGSGLAIQAGTSKGIKFNVNNSSFGSGTVMFLTSDGSLGIGTTSPLASSGLDVEKNALGDAALVANQLGAGDIFTASASGTTLFRVTNAGSVVFSGDPLNVGSGASGNGSNAIHNDLGDTGSLLPNPGFESAVTNSIADAWYPAATTSAGIFTHDTTTRAKGDASLQVLQTNNTVAIYSACVPVSGAIGKYILNYYAIGSSSTKANLASFIDGYTSKANCQSDTSPTRTVVKVAPTTASWAAYGTGVNTAIGSFGSTATWARVHFIISTSGTSVQTNIDGVRFTEDPGSTGNGGLDYAENYPANPTNIPHAGDLVALDDASNAPVAQVIPADTTNTNIIGIVSTNPGEVLDDGTVSDPKVPVALAGRVPVHVSIANGSISIGDYLGPSSIPGVAVKATIGPTIGIAMQSYSASNVGQIMVFVNKSSLSGSNATFSSTNNGILTLIGSDNSAVTVSVARNTVSIKGSDGSDAVSIDSQGNATFKGIITANKIEANQIEGLDIFTNRLSALGSEVNSLQASVSSQFSDPFATVSAILGIATPSGILHLDSLSVDGLATVSADFRVKGSTLLEGIVSIVDTLTAHNAIITGISDFFGQVILHSDLDVTGKVSVGSNTAGTITLAKGTTSVHVSFTSTYDTAPVITATLNTSNADTATMQQILAQNYSYVVGSITPSGFTIYLNKPAQQDIEFSWVALQQSTIDKGVQSINSSSPNSSDSSMLTPEPTGVMP